MASPLGSKVIVALVEQGWTVSTHEGALAAGTPDQDKMLVFPVELFTDSEHQLELTFGVIQALKHFGFTWPWTDSHEG